MTKLLIKNASELVTCSGNAAKKGKQMSDLHVIRDGAIASSDGVITHVGKTEDVLTAINEDDYVVIDATGKTVMPGFVDSHTHFVFGGFRADEYGWRLEGQSYVDIMEKGGGIANSVRGTDQATFQELIDVGMKRLNSMLSFGVTTVEGKSGYGLFKDTELKQLKVYKALKEMHPMDIAVTYLGPHSVPKEYKGNEMAFIEYQIKECLPEVMKLDVAEFADIFCEDKVFNVEQSRAFLTAAKELGLKLKIHADEIVQLGGAELAAELGAVSADHLLQASDKGIEQMAEAGVVATLLPGTAFSLKEHYARARYMIDHGAAVALATDFNPGSCFTESVALIIALATLQMNMTTEEVITALTINGAAALGRADTVGSLDEGKLADIVIHEFPSYKFLPYHIAVSTVETVIKKGEIVYERLY
ncbi:imidazolonepropionase [Fusibacter sp. A1]|nr:imidazolonepropionase [Fusibacter sp. A1]MCK8060777.1 imidazolonepropionase [Fusibacter sp. A2]NPE23073.1 imidazolonepropionase [Fusibacter sp. A1]RXV59810.1 imidazolonepropionase [Fusibacter sp. A1]